MLKSGNGAILKAKYNILDIEKYPQIYINYYDPIIDVNDDVVIPFYCTDFYQLEYRNDDYSRRFKLRYEIDGVVKYKDGLKAGDNSINFGKLEEGIHSYTIQVIDEYGRDSRRICDNIWIKDIAGSEITSSQVYTITDEDLIRYSINKENSEVEQDMINNRVGLSQMFLDIRDQGYRKCILPEGIYRINRTIRRGTGDETPIDIPSNFTVDMNGATFKLHPYTDTEYGTIAQVENLMVRMLNTVDSHLINGIIEGDYAERQANGWISGSNGEHSNAFYSYGAEFCSLENITIQQVTGYNVCAGQDGNLASDLGKHSWIENKNIVNGVEVDAEGYMLTSLKTIGEKSLANKYLIAGVWLGYAGIKGTRWDVWFHFYNENDNFIETIHSYQYTRCKIPAGASKFRVSLVCSAEEASSLGFDHMKSTRYFALKNCHWIDNRTCAATFQAQHYTFYECDFTRSGQSITPCEIDFEDGWERQQDFFIINCQILENTGTSDIIDNSGINHQMIGCKNMRYVARYRLVGLTIRDCENISVSINVGYMSKNSFRIFNNKNCNGFSYGTTGYFDGYKDCMYLFKNNTNSAGKCDSYSDSAKFLYKDCELIGDWGNI